MGYKNNRKNYNKKPKTKEEQFEDMLHKALKDGNDKRRAKSKNDDKKVKNHKYIVKKEVKEDKTNNNNEN